MDHFSPLGVNTTPKEIFTTLFSVQFPEYLLALLTRLTSLVLTDPHFNLTIKIDPSYLMRLVYKFLLKPLLSHRSYPTLLVSSPRGGCTASFPNLIFRSKVITELWGWPTPLPPDELGSRVAWPWKLGGEGRKGRGRGKGSAKSKRFPAFTSPGGCTVQDVFQS